MGRLSNFQRIELRFRQIERNAGSGGGGPTAWGSITGSLSSQTDLVSALGAKADASTTTAALAGKADDAATTAALAGKADASATTAALAAKQDTVLAGTAVVTVPNNALEASATVTAAVTPSSRIFLSLGTMTDADENSADMLDLMGMGAIPGTGSFDIVMAFATPSAGPIPVNWSVI